MSRFLRRFARPIVAAALQLSPMPLAAQLYTNPLPTKELYRMARERATAVNDKCVGALSSYLEAVGYMYAYIQAAGRDGSLRSNPAFEQGFRQQFDDVLDRAQRCLKAYPPASGSAFRSDGSETFRQEAPPPGIILPAQPPASPDQPDQAAAPQTDALGRTIPQLVAQVNQLLMDRDRLDAEVARLRNELAAARPPATPAPTDPPPTRTGVEYRIRVKADGLFWHLDGGGDNLVSTRYQPNDDFTRFVIVPAGDGVYRLQNKATGRYLYGNGSRGGFVISSTTLPNDDFSVFLLVAQPDGSFRIQHRASGLFLHEDGSNDKLVSTRYQVDDDFTRFFFVP